MTQMFYDVSLSEANLDATLVSWAGQALQSSISFHLGLKTYSTTGATALDTLRDTFDWAITEQYQARYSPGTNATLIGTGYQAPLNSGDSTTDVEIIPQSGCTFLGWSDDSLDNPRSDTLTDDNLTVSAVLDCPSSGSSGTSLSGQIAKLKAQGNYDQAEALKQQYNLPNTLLTDGNRAAISETLDRLRELLDQPIKTDDQNAVRELLDLLTILITALMQLRLML